jgi:hypothetical protein
VLPVKENAQQIAYRGQLPKSVSISRADALSFANKFASETGMTNTEVFPEIDSLAKRFIDISVNGPNRMSAAIMIDNDVNQMFIVVYGDPSCPIVQEIAHKGVKLFQDRYPEANIVLYTLKH